MPPRLRSLLALLALVAVGATAALTVRTSGGGAAPPAPSWLRQASEWRGLVGQPRPRVDVGERVLVVLSAFSLADRVARAGGYASDRDERRWTAAAFAAQQQLIANLDAEGVHVRPVFRYTRTINGFSALLDAKAIAVLERTRGVRAVYPVRVAYPAAVSRTGLDGAVRPATPLGRFRGSGVTIALLDTGVDLRRPYLHGHVADGVDVVGRNPDARAVAKPGQPTALETHGTEIAGLLVGVGGAGGVHGVAPDATVYPVRVAGWQPTVGGGFAVYARTDQVLAGLERAVDPNGDGDAHDAARIALMPLAEPFAAFADSPLARAATGALRLDTLVVVPAGNDGPAGPAFGSVSGPGGAPDALTVGAADTRSVAPQVRVVGRAGLSVVLDRVVDLVNGSAPSRPVTLQPIAVPDGRFFARSGLSRVAGRVAIAPAGGSPADTAEAAARAGAAAVLLYGQALPPGGLTSAGEGVPVVAVPAPAARLLARSKDAVVALAGAEAEPVGHAAVAPFSSWGLSFAAAPKPEVLAPGVAMVTAGAGSRAFTAVSGTSAAAAVAAGDAALVAEARPSLDAASLRAVLVGTARPVAGAPAAAQGAGLLDAGRAVASEVAADPATVAFGRARGDGWQGRQDVRLENVSARPLTLFVTLQGRTRSVVAAVRPQRLVVPAGGSARLSFTLRLVGSPRGRAATGVVVVTPVGGVPVRIPWAAVLGGDANLLGPILLSRRSFAPSERLPAVVTFRVGSVVSASHAATAVQPAQRLDVELWTARGKRLGLLARLRDVLPGRYAFGLTGRGPRGQRLARGRYRVRIFAWPASGGPSTSRSVVVAIR